MSIRIRARAIEEPQSEQREIEIANSDWIIILGTPNYFKPGNVHYDLEAARKYGKKILVLLKPGTVIPEGVLPEDAVIVPDNFDDPQKTGQILRALLEQHHDQG